MALRRADLVPSTHNLSGRVSVKQPENSPTDTLSVAEVSQIVTPNYSKRPSYSIERRPHLNSSYWWPGLSPNKPIAIVQANVQVKSPPVEVISIRDGNYVIKNRTRDIFWGSKHWPSPYGVHFYPVSTPRFMEIVKKYTNCGMQVNEPSPIIQVFRR